MLINFSITATIIALLVLIFVNGYFAASKTAIKNVNKIKMKELTQAGNKNAAAVLKQLEDADNFLSKVHVVMTVVSALVSVIAACCFTDNIVMYLADRFYIPANLLTVIPIIIVTIVLSYAVLVFSVVYPEKVAMQHSDRIAMMTVGPVNFIGSVFKPFAVLISASASILLVLTRQKVHVENDEFSEDEVKSMLEAGQESGVLKEEGRKMINSIFEFDDKLAYEIMTPRTDVFAIDINDPVADFLDELMEMRYSRIPVYDDDFDRVIGILNIKDYLIKAREDGFENVDIASIIRKAHFVPETKNIDSLFFELQKMKQHIAILIDEYGGFSGIVTMEDIIEEVMGEIDDEYDEEEIEYEQIDENTYLVSGSMDLDDMNEAIGTNLSSEDSETIGGLIVDLLGEIPEEGSNEELVVEHENYVFKIESVKDRRIEKVKLCIMPEAADNKFDKNTEE